MKSTTDQYLSKLSEVLAENSDEENPAQMKRYMKNLFPFFGIKSPLRKKLFKQFIINEGLPSIPEVKEVTLALYKKPKREFRYFAMELVNKYSKELDEKGIKLFKHIIVSRSCWDTVDYIAANSLSSYFRVYPGMIRIVTAVWMDFKGIFQSKF